MQCEKVRVVGKHVLGSKVDEARHRALTYELWTEYGMLTVS